MLHLALAALLAGSLGTGAIAATDDGDKDKTPRTEAAVGLTADEQPITDTYAYSFDEEDFLNLWAGFGWAQVDEFYTPSGGTSSSPHGTSTVMRGFFGAHANLVRFGGMSIGLGGQMMVGSSEVGGASSGFGLHSLKFYGELSGRSLGLHAGYILDFNDPADPAPHISDGLDAWFVGFSFDYQPDWLRVFGGTDMFRFIDHPSGGTGWDAPSVVVFNVGGGVEFGWVALGVAGYWRSNIVAPRVAVVGGGSHQRGIAPYLTLSPDFLPVGIAIKGAVFGEYADYGFSLGGAQDIVTNTGVSVALTFGI